MEREAIVVEGDCIEVMQELPDASIDAVVCDPPYGLAFMGKKWDDLSSTNQMQEWHEAWAREVLQVLKPGGHLLAFGGTRTYHRLACAIEDAGFEIRDSVMWIYGSGFPKSHNISKAIDKAAGATEAARQYSGFGTALKPAHEPIVVARKPFKSTVAANVLKHGTGAMNIDGCRIGTDENLQSAGRWPANLAFSHLEECTYNGTQPAESYTINRFDDGAKPFGGGAGHAYTSERVDEQTVEVWECAEGCPVNELNRQSGIHTSGVVKSRKEAYDGESVTGFIRGFADKSNMPGGTGGASRFFYCAKANRKERNAGLDIQNGHPTVKPIALMRWLIRLVTPPDGYVLDPFVGSGTTGIAAKLEGFDFIGIEKEAEYVKMAQTRIDSYEER